MSPLITSEQGQHYAQFCVKQNKKSLRYSFQPLLIPFFDGMWDHCTSFHTCLLGIYLFLFPSSSLWPLSILSYIMPFFPKKMALTCTPFLMFMNGSRSSRPFLVVSQLCISLISPHWFFSCFPFFLCWATVTFLSHPLLYSGVVLINSS